MTAKHTPGPWILETVRTEVGVCHKIGKLGALTTLSHACLYDDCHSDKPGDMQLLADARLIAAAPDLLEILKNLTCCACGHRIGWTEKHTAEDGRLGRFDWDTCLQCGTARAAIAKAEGRT